MVCFGFTNKPNQGKAIRIFNYGNCKRDFPYLISDCIGEWMLQVIQKVPFKSTGNHILPVPPCALCNIGNNCSENLLDFVIVLQKKLFDTKDLPVDYDFEVHKKLVPM